jgi:hypothetical protein
VPYLQLSSASNVSVHGAFMKKIFYIISVLLLTESAFAVNLIKPATAFDEQSFAESARFLMFQPTPLSPTVTYPLVHHALPRGERSFYFSGYIKAEPIWDSWQVRSAAQDTFLVFPEDPVLDRCKRNINHKGRFQMTDIETTIRAEIKGPSFYGAQTHGVMSCDFRAGDLNNVIGFFRVVQGFMLMEWQDKALLMGQFWHPVFPADYKCYPMTISYNYGLPIDPYTYDSQIRFTKQFDNISMVFSLLSHNQRRYSGPDMTLPVPEPVNSTLYPRNAIMPNFNLLIVAALKEHRLGWCFDAVRIVPRIKTTKNVKTRESIMSFLAMLFLVLDIDNLLTIKLKGIWAQNGSGYVMMSGYAVKCVEPLTDQRTYANLQCVSTWMDLNFKNVMPFEPGLFFGFTKNLGADTRIIPNIGTETTIYTPGGRPPYYSVGSRARVDYILRFSPRLRYYARPFMIGAELEFTRALWGDNDDWGRVVNTTPANNTRLLIGAYFFF